LGKAGSVLWRRLVDEYSFDERELAVLCLACRQAVDLALVEEAIARDGATVVGRRARLSSGRVTVVAGRGHSADHGPQE
jgi:hypothetical protein